MKREYNPQLYDWLQFHWKRDNHNKYQKYFVEWIANITENQILGFTKQMDNEIYQKNVQHVH